MPGGNETAFVFSARDQGLSQAQDRIAQKANKIETEFTQVAAAGRASRQELGAFVDRLERMRATPIERARREQEKLKQAVAAGSITQERANELMNRGSDNLGRFVNKLENLHSTPVEKLAREQRRLNEAVQRGHIDQQRANQLWQRMQGDTGFLSKIPVSLKAIAAGFVGGAGISSGIQVALEMMRNFNAETDEAISTLQRLKTPDTRLAQIATGADDLRNLQTRADELSVKYALDRDVTRELLFSARSEGFDDQVEAIARNRNVISIAAGTAAASASTKFQDIDVLQALNVASVAAAESKFNFEKLTEQVGKAAQGATVAGASGTETFAAASVLASVFEESTGDRLKAFLTKVGISDQTKGLGLIEAFESLRDAAAEDRKKFLGDSQELNTVYSALEKHIVAIKEREQELRSAAAKAGTSESDLAGKRETTEVNERIIARERTKRGELRREIATENQLAIRGSLTKEALDTEVARLREQDTSEASVQIAQRAGEAARFAGGDANLVRGATIAGSEALSSFERITPGGQVQMVREIANDLATTLTDAILARMGIANPISAKAAEMQLEAAKINRDTAETNRRRPRPQRSSRNQQRAAAALNQ